MHIWEEADDASHRKKTGWSWGLLAFVDIWRANHQRQEDLSHFFLFLSSLPPLAHHPAFQIINISYSFQKEEQIFEHLLSCTLLSLPNQGVTQPKYSTSVSPWCKISQPLAPWEMSVVHTALSMIFCEHNPSRLMQVLILSLTSTPSHHNSGPRSLSQLRKSFVFVAEHQCMCELNYL